jgi:hypothetical protein
VSRRRRFVVYAGVAVTFLTAADAGSAPTAPTLEARAVLPAQTFAAGPPSGAAIGPGPFNGIRAPFPSQPVGGFSAVVPAPAGDYFAVTDNGYGSKPASRDFLIRIYRLGPQWKTATGGTGTVRVVGFSQLRDPDHKIPWPIVNDGTAERSLTGADFDPEALALDGGGGFWVGEEYGPFMLHVDATGRLLEAPVELPGVRSPENPLLKPGEAATLPGSGGIRGIARSPDGKHLYTILGKTLIADQNLTRRLIHEYDVAGHRFTGRVWQYRSEASAVSVDELVALDSNRFLTIERDGTQGRDAQAGFKRVFLIDLRDKDRAGFLVKRQVVDLVDILDPAQISLPARPGDVGLGNPFSLPFSATEALWPLSPTRLLLVNDNNFPFGNGRNPALPEDTEFVIVQTPPLPATGPQGPKWGVVGRAWMSLAGSSRPVSKVGRAPGLQANFLFRVRPVAGSQLRLTWYQGGKRVFVLPRQRTTLVTSSLFVRGGLPRGTYRAVLEVRAPGSRYRVVATARARVG